MLTTENIDTILTALHERRNRLINIETNGEVHVPARPKLRGRIEEVNRAIRALKGMNHVS